MAENVETPERWRLEKSWDSLNKDLEEKGYAVLPGVLTAEECDGCISQYREWLSQFDEDEAPYHLRSLIQHYRIGHFEASWKVRLKTKPVFASIWKTDKLLSSFDAVAIGEPPEISGNFSDPEDKWLHIDQGEFRQGLHAYQGAVYLEETAETDWVFRVLVGSHKHHQTFYEAHVDAAERGRIDDFCKLKDDEIDWYKSKGCELTSVPVPKGGMVLWDSRLIHDNHRPQIGRPNSDRWRFVVFVSMTPAIWASKRDLGLRKTAYRNMFLTTHWSSQGVNFFEDDISDFHKKRIQTLKFLPQIAQTDEAKYLSGVLEYDFRDKQPNGDHVYPRWKSGEYASD